VVESDPRNEIYFKVWAKPAAPVQAGNGPSVPVCNDGASTAAISELGDIARALLDRQRQEKPASKESALDPAVVSLRQDTAKQRDALAEKVASYGTANPAVDPISLLDKVLGVVEKMNRTGASMPPAKSTVEQLQEMVALIGSLKETFGAPEGTSATAASEDGSVLRAILTAVSPVLSQLAGPIGQAIAMKVMNPVPGGGATPGTTFNPAAFGPGPSPTSPVPAGMAGMNAPGTPAGMPAASPGTATFAPPQPENGSAASVGETPSEGPEIAARAHLFQLAGQIGPCLLNALNQGCDGGAFAESLTTLYGGLAYEQIAALGKEGIIGALQSQPQFWPQLAPIQARVEQFVEEFLAVGLEEQEGDEEQEDRELSDPKLSPGSEAAAPKRKKNTA
jgi:hypothetical protein